MSRANLEAFIKLHNSLMYVRTVKELAVPLEQLAANVLDPKLFKRYIEYQGNYKDRVDLLRTEPRETPAEANADRIMPPIMKKWIGALSAHQNPHKNHETDSSCAFDDARIKKYEAANKTFTADLKLDCQASALKVAALLVMDIAFNKSFEVEWERPPTALVSADATDSDDAAGEVDFLHWDFTQPDSLPWDKLPVCDDTGKLFPHAVVAGKIASHVRTQHGEKNMSEPMRTFAHKIKKAKDLLDQKMAGLLQENPGEFLKQAMTREFNDDEESAYFNNMCRSLDGKSDSEVSCVVFVG